MTTFTTYDQVGKAEDVSKVISNITPTDTPFQSAIGSESTSAKVYQFQEDDIRGVRDNAVIEGADAVTKARTPTRMRQNYTQIMEDTFAVSGSSQKIKLHGRTNEKSYQSMLASKGLKRDLESALVGRVQNAVQGNKTDTAGRFGNVLGQDPDSANIVSTRVSASNLKMTEAQFTQLHQNLYNNGSNPTTFMVTPLDSLTVASFATASGRERDIGNSKRVVNAVDVLVTPFGEVKVVLNRFMQAYIGDDAAVGGEQVDPTSSNDGDSNPDQYAAALLFDPKMWALRWLRKWNRTPLAKTGDSDKYQILGELTLQHRNYGASGLLTNIGIATE